MRKIKKIVLLSISVVVVLSVFVLNTFAYNVGRPGQTGYFPGVDPVIPASSCRVEKTNGYTLTPTSFFTPDITSTWGDTLYMAGDEESSVRSVVRYREGGMFATYQGGLLEYHFTSINDFEFTIDFGNILTEYSQFVSPDAPFTPVLLIGVSAGYYNLFSTNNQTPYGDYLSMTFGSDLSVCSTYQSWSSETNEYGGFMTYIDEGYTDQNQIYRLFDGGEGRSLNTISGSVTSSPDTGYPYNYVKISISTYGTYYYEPFNFSLFGYYVNNVPSYYLSELNRRNNADVIDAIGSSEYNRGYNSGYGVGKTDGYNDGYSKGQDYGYTLGYQDGEDYGYDIGYDIGENNGYSDGYYDGYDEGVEKAIEDRGLFAFIIDSLEAFFSYPLFDLPNGGHISLGLLLGVILGALVFVWILKLIAGG